jgi:hypothetical protein
MWLIASLSCVAAAVVLFLFEPKADRKGYGKLVAVMRLVVILFAIGYFVAWLLRSK